MLQSSLINIVYQLGIRGGGGGVGGERRWLRSEKRGWGLNGFLFLKRGVYLTCDVFERGLNRGCTVKISDGQSFYFSIKM